MDTQSEKTKEILKKVRQIEIRTRTQLTDSMSGAYQSIFKGRGMDFEEVREYFIGDDVRSIDWNVTAKMDRPFIKKFREERELTLMLMVDLSGSGAYGSGNQTKRELIAELGSLLAFSATRNNDKVGLILFTDKVELYIPPKKGKFHVLRLIREILFFQPKNKGTDLIHALDYLNRVTKRKAIVFLISDFIMPKMEINKRSLFPYMDLTSKKHDLICIRAIDRLEEELPSVGIINIEDAETGDIIEIDTKNKHFRASYRKENIQRLREFETKVNQIGVDLLNVYTNESYITPLRTFMKRRMSRR